MIEWRIYYDDLTTFDSTQGTPEEAPSHGIICIVQPDESGGRMVLCGWDWYYYNPEGGSFWGSDVHGLLDRLLHNIPTRAVKIGRMVTSEKFHAIRNKALVDEDFPPRSGAIVKRERPFQYY